MYEFTPFKNTDYIHFESFMQFPRELSSDETYKELTSVSMML